MGIRKILVMAAGTCVAFSASAGTVAYVNYSTLLKKAPQVKASAALLQKEYAPRLKSIQKKMLELRSLAKQLSTMGPSSNSIQRDSMIEKYEKARSHLNKSEQSYETAFQLRRSQLRDNFNQLVDKDIKQYARAHGIDVVLKDSVVYEAEEVNITVPILKRLKEQYQEARSKTSKKQ